MDDVDAQVKELEEKGHAEVLVGRYGNAVRFFREALKRVRLSAGDADPRVAELRLEIDTVLSMQGIVLLGQQAGESWSAPGIGQTADGPIPPDTGE